MSQFRQTVTINGSQVTGYQHEDYYRVSLCVDVVIEQQTRHHPGGSWVEAEIQSIECDPTQETEWTDDIDTFRDKLDRWIDSEHGSRELMDRACEGYEQDRAYHEAEKLERERDRRNGII